VTRGFGHIGFEEEVINFASEKGKRCVSGRGKKKEDSLQIVKQEVCVAELNGRHLI
jgi:hypothetical protein